MDATLSRHWQSSTVRRVLRVRISHDGHTAGARVGMIARIESPVIERCFPLMDDGREVSESLVTCNPCSRIGCHVAVERAIRELSPPPSPFTLSGLPLAASCILPVPFHLPVSRTWLPCGRTGARSVCETHGSRNTACARVPSVAWCSPVSVRHP